MIFPKTWVVLAVAVSFNSTVFADDKADLNALLAKGADAYRKGDVRAALGHLLQAKAIKTSPIPALYTNIAQCYRILQKPRKALAYYEEYFEEWARFKPQTEAAYSKEITQFIVELRQQVKALGPEQPSASQPTNTKKPKVEVNPKPEQPKAVTKPAATSSPLNPNEDQKLRRNKTIWGYSTLAIGGAAAIVAAILYGVGATQYQNAHDLYLASESGAEMDRHWSDVESADVKLVAGHVMAGLAVSAIAFSIYSFATRPERAPTNALSTRNASLSIRPSTGAIHVGLNGTF